MEELEEKDGKKKKEKINSCVYGHSAGELKLCFLYKECHLLKAK